ncbi:MAG: Fic family protein [Lentisphaerae bacterium]|jgi:Fic family protein|nr:Fic family protein [Lentisphaerota bacterium]MBT4821928.1 Fic family protein [Lentisphaerota bacterium]MBT5607214.1 Fic family protein [Lentisphaerota bacterium]MBT7054239.1 Fic family protein [Lentisphaerota bacterium]MBT7842660.1 Fic family protein [Lentisphaerota bacterium]
MAKSLHVFKAIEHLRSRYYAVASGKESLIRMIAEAEVSEQVFNSNAIENSTLSLDETEKILLQIDLDRFISERELFEAKNLAGVVSYIDTRAVEQPLSLDVLLLLHKMLLANIRDDVAGRFRQEGEWVRVGSHIAPGPEQVAGLLDRMLADYHSASHENAIKRVAKLHLTFEHIHPFVDGNGRIGRALNNYVLNREGYVPINIKFVDRAQYYEAFREFDSGGRTRTMEEIVGRALTNSYHKRLAYLEGVPIILLADYARKYRLSHSNLLNKAKRQTIEAFLEKGVWKIGDRGEK